MADLDDVLELLRRIEEDVCLLSGDVRAVRSELEALSGRLSRQEQALNVINKRLDAIDARLTAREL